MRAYFDKMYKDTKDSFYNIVDNYIKNNVKKIIVTVNPETINYALKNIEFNNILLAKDTVLIPDGISIVKGGRILKKAIKERITGIDLMEYLLNISNQNKYIISLIGAKEEVLTKLIKRIKKDYANIRIGRSIDGYKDLDNFMDNLSKEDVDIVFVALGVPKQELLIAKHLDQFKKGIFIGVGGSFDVLSGDKKRAPKFMQKLNLEWLYRIIKEPKRIIRFIKNNVVFMFKVILLSFRKD